MGRKLGPILVLVIAGLSASASAAQGSISGHVKDVAGKPQMGAMVRAVSYAQASQVYTAFTNESGYYSFSGLLPGSYDVDVTAASYLPTLRENISLKAGASLVVNLTLNTLSDAIRLLPAKRGTQEDDDWKWTLRSAANRPILRLKNGQPVVIDGANTHPMTGTVALLAGSSADGFGPSNEMSTNFTVERSIFQTGLLSVGGDVGYGPGPNTTILRSSYSHQMPDGSKPEVSITMRRFAVSPTDAVHDAAMEALSATVADTITLADVIELRAGSEFQTVQFMGHVNAYKPFGSMDVHLSPNSVLEFQYATSPPNTRMLKGFDSAPADMSESGPRMSLVDQQSVLEKARHEEVSLSRRMGEGKTAIQVALYSDRISNAALTGVGELDPSIANILPDYYSGTFSYNAGDLSTSGARLVVQRKLSNGMTATVDYAFGGVLDLTGRNVPIDDVQSFSTMTYRHTVGAKMAGTVAHTKTQWIASYKWMSGSGLTPVDLFNAGPGQSDPYFNLFIRQPLPGMGFMPGKMEALIDVRNLLAQGYQPVMAPDGQTVYLVQSARSVRGGVAFTF